MDAVRNEVKRRAAVHDDRRARMMRENIDRNVVRWIFAPPALPFVVRPFASDRPKHVATENPCTDVLEPARAVLIVGSGGASLFAHHVLEGPGGKKPFMESLSAEAERVFDVLVGSSA